MAEALAEAELRRRDPVKRAIFFGAFLVTLSLVWYTSMWVEGLVEKSGLNQIESEIQKHTNENAQVQTNLKKIMETQRQLEALQQLSSARFLNGTLLNTLQHTYVPKVQLTRFRVEQLYLSKPGIAAKTNNSVVVPGRPGTITEKILLTLEAKDFNPNSGSQINRLKDTLNRQEYFKTSLDPTNGIRLANLSPPQSTIEGKPFVLFTLECRFLDKTQ